MKRLCLLIIVITLSVSGQAMEWQWLDNMRQSMQQLNYRGEFILRRGDISSAYAVVHRFDEVSGSTELLRQLDGNMIEVLRTEQEVVCVYPENVELSVQHPLPAAPFSQITEMDLKRISENYMVSAMGQQRVAGHLAEVILLQGDESRYRHRLWLEKDSHLLLQSEILDDENRVLEQFRFTRVELGVPIAAADLAATTNGQEFRQEVSPRDMKLYSDHDFISRPNWLPTGAMLVHSERRQTETGWYEKRSYSDGMASFSIFVETVMPGTNLPSSSMQAGATAVLMTYRDGYSITIVGEVPLMTARKLAQQLLIPEVAL